MSSSTFCVSEISIILHAAQVFSMIVDTKLLFSGRTRFESQVVTPVSRLELFIRFLSPCRKIGGTKDRFGSFHFQLGF